MEFRKKRLTVSEAKEMDMVHCLSQLGFEPVNIIRNDHWYPSPLREERTPSFKVNSALNRWYDHGTGKGGNLVDFGVLFWECSVADALVKLSGDFSFQQQRIPPVRSGVEHHGKIKILDSFLLSSWPLQLYLQQRKIPLEIATLFCGEVRYELGEKVWYGIGFKNDLGGYEIRNAYHKLSSSPKAITTIKNGAENLVIFESFFDFLSFIVICQSNEQNYADYIILNSLAFLEAIHPILNSYNNISLFLDNDNAGKNACKLVLTWGKQCQDESRLYEGYDDLNEWLVYSPQAQKYQHSQITAGNPMSEKPPNVP
ncbi:DNA primase [Flavobacterium zepuense]|uniref:DNA primase n=1 Tax=Flavobacterium zepuense TaxID=2593302 RepID=A0A552UTC5_9FLAO|nr:toprim domain-containing protein [Flavobacterium zepuense]TRW21476.1 DNA primase [Flavobacterium zepuense]